MSASWIPVVAAVVSGAALLAGYAYQKAKDREFEVRRTRQDVYTRVINNLTKKLVLFDRARTNPSFPLRISRDNIIEAQNLIETHHPDLGQAMDESREVMALLAVYGSDEAIGAAETFYDASLRSMEPGNAEVPDVGELIRVLRKSLFSKSRVTAHQINRIIAK